MTIVRRVSANPTFTMISMTKALIPLRLIHYNLQILFGILFKLPYRMIRHITALIICIVVGSLSLMADGPRNRANREQWYNNMIQTKIDYLAKQMSLTPQQKEKFEKSYRDMSNETSRLARDTRSLERQVSKKANPSDLEYEKAAEAITEFKAKEGAIELKYFNQFKTFLNKKQLFQLKLAENKWMDELMRHRGKGKNKR